MSEIISLGYMQEFLSSICASNDILQGKEKIEVEQFSPFERKNLDCVNVNWTMPGLMYSSFLIENFSHMKGIEKPWQ